MSDGRWSLILHGGARSIPAQRQSANREGCRRAADAGAELLRGGGAAIDAVEQVVRLLEDDVTFNAGSGSVPNLDGVVEMDAAIMDGQTLDIGAVAALREVRNPVAVARLLLREPSVLLVGDGAQAFAESMDVPRVVVASANGDEPHHDTVGCVAFDQRGRIAVATSTGGLSGQLAGRVGDAPIPGCGFYADSARGGVAISGDGESILRVLLAARVIEELHGQRPNVAVGAALRRLERVGGEAGMVVLDRLGRMSLAHNSEHFAVAVAASWLPATIAGMHLDDFQGYDLDG